ncbi:Phosphorylated carbohydrates phosphatase [Pseudomonas fluorescens]|jgi:HAD superfamily hydrolase (TIGR01509 family)|uniref:HAD family hydrolase n=1 Tax=Pseudomonas silesiensis TaxID=1853130 RepID=A0A191YV12_9PSED|nr:HAD family phosphatase [Pseudomonas silesiensis]ANJ56715.1 HAD family hydrolase [Pseudomonas silesiensis]VVP42610.1 Phosphorylated carbohydrates phosphatase [Pseudomonas fluorescens]
MLAIKAVIFDMDGVLIDSEPLYMEQERHSCARHGVLLDKTKLSRFVGTTQRYMWSAIKNEYGLTEPLNCLMAQHQRQVIHAMSSESLSPMPGTQTLITTLKQAGISCAVASSSPSELVEVILHGTKLRRFFNDVICGDDVTQSKPDPEIFLLAAKRLGIAPGSCLVIEDSTHGISAAKAANMFCIGLLNPNSGQQDLSAADLCVHNHDEIRQWLMKNKQL